MENTNKCEGCPVVMDLNHELLKLSFARRTGNLTILNSNSITQAKADIALKIDTLKSNCNGFKASGWFKPRCQSINLKRVTG